MGGILSCSDRRGFWRKGYSKTRFRGERKGDMENESAAIISQASPGPISSKSNEARKGSRTIRSPDPATSSPRRNFNRASGRDFDGVSAVEAKRIRLINVNTCTASDLMTLDGVDQSVATNVVLYREKKGLFKRLDKLLKVPGLTKSVYRQIAPYVTIVAFQPNDINGTPNSNSRAFDAGNLVARGDADGNYNRQSSAFSSLKSSAIDDRLDLSLTPADAENCKDLEQANIDLIYRLMCSKSPRPKAVAVSDTTSGCVGASLEQPTAYDSAYLRLGCWDLEECSFDKANNPGVLEVICMTILENGWNVAVMVNLVSDHVLDRLVTELNFPTSQKVKNWRQTCRAAPKFDCVTFRCGETDSFYGCLFAVQFVALRDDVASCIALKVGALNVTFSFDPTSSDDEPTSMDNIIVIRRRNNVSENGNSLHFGCYSISWCDSLGFRFTGRAGVVEDGLSHLAIPNGWTLGGRVTRSNPMWIYFSLID